MGKKKDLTKKKISEGIACIACVPPNTSVFSNPELKEIQDVINDEKVLDGNGDWINVTNTFKRHYSGEIFDIFIKYQNFPLTLTPEHPILVTRMKPCPYYQGYCTPGKHTHLCKNCTIKHYLFYEPTYMLPSELFVTKWKSNYIEDKLFLMFPRIKKIKDKRILNLIDYLPKGYRVIGNEILKFTTNSYKYRNGKSVVRTKKVGKGAPDKILINNDFMKLVGLYLAEGHVQKCARGGSVVLSFGKHEKILINETTSLIKNVFKISPTIRYKQTAISIEIYSEPLYILFKMLFGSSSKDKKIPNWVFLLPFNKQKNFLKGYFLGDGCIHKGKYNVISCNSVSKKLVGALKLILIRLGFTFSENKFKAKNNRMKIEGRLVNISPFKYCIQLNGESAKDLISIVESDKTKFWKYRESHQTGIDKNYIYYPIRRINKRQYDGVVMNLETKSHTYVADGIIVHNCSSDHLMTASGAIDEASRMAQGGKDIDDNEIISRLGTAKRELDIMERIDLTDKKIMGLKGEEKKLALDVKNKSAEIRHGIMGVKAMSDLIELSATASKAWEDVWARAFKLAKEPIFCPVKKSVSDYSVNGCKQGKVENPKTKRCIKACPVGKIRNFKTGRCIKG